MESLHGHSTAHIDHEPASEHGASLRAATLGGSAE
jgi:hypothetical protein